MHKRHIAELSCVAGCAFVFYGVGYGCWKLVAFVLCRGIVVVRLSFKRIFVCLQLSLSLRSKYDSSQFNHKY